jgi:hypothetical protein
MLRTLAIASEAAAAGLALDEIGQVRAAAADQRESQRAVAARDALGEEALDGRTADAGNLVAHRRCAAHAPEGIGRASAAVGSRSKPMRSLA